MKLATLGYTLVGALAGSMVVSSFCLLALSHKFNGTLATLDHAYFEQVLPLRQIVTNSNDIRYYLLTTTSKLHGSAEQESDVKTALLKNQLLWQQLERVPTLDLMSVHRKYQDWLNSSVLPLMALAQSGARRDVDFNSLPRLATYRTFERAMNDEIAAMRRRGEVRHEHLATLQRHIFYLALTLTFFTITGAAWTAWCTIKRHSFALDNANRSLADANRELEQRVTQRTAALQYSNIEMRKLLTRLHATQDQLVQNEKLAALGFLVAGIAHELNTPIGNGVLTASTLAGMIKELQFALSDKIQRKDLTDRIAAMVHCCALLEQSLHKSSRLVSRFREVAVDQHGEPRRKFEVAKLLHNIHMARKSDLRDADCVMTIKVPSGLMLVSYARSLARVLDNLIDNALLHAFDGRLGRRIDIVVRGGDAQFVEIMFRDNGHGMSAQVLQRIFDPFFTTKMGHGSGGLGMTIVHNTVTVILGGTITVSARETSGTAIDIIIPRNAPGVHSTRQEVADIHAA